MEFLSKLAYKIGNNLVHSAVIEEEDAEIYIYGINQILVSMLNVSSALIIGLIFGVLWEIAVFMAAYIPLRSFAGGYHARTPLRCYILSIIMLIVVSVSIKYLIIPIWTHYALLAMTSLIIMVLSPVEDSNKPLDEIEHKIYKKRSLTIMSAEILISLVFKFTGLNSLFTAVVYSFVVLSGMLIVGKLKNIFLQL